MSTSVQQNDRAWLSHRDISEHTIEIKRHILRIIVTILLEVQTRTLDDIMVITPGRIANEDFTIVEFSKEFKTDSQCTCSWNSLRSDNSSILNGSAILAKDELLSSSIELSQTIDWKIFLINRMIIDNLAFNLTDYLKGIRLFVIVSVSTNTQVHFVLRSVSFVSQCGTQNWIRRS